MIVVVTLILEHRHVGEHCEAMGEPPGDEQLPVIVLRQLYRHMLAVGRRALADVHRHIEHRTLHASDELRLRERRPLGKLWSNRTCPESLVPYIFL